MAKISYITIGSTKYGINATELGGVAASGYAKVDSKIGCNTVTSISNVPVTKYMAICNLTAAGSFSINGTMTAGQELHVIVNNNGSDTITIAIPTTYKTNAESIDIDAGSFGEINAVSDGTDIYVRAI